MMTFDWSRSRYRSYTLDQSTVVSRAGSCDTKGRYETITRPGLRAIRATQAPEPVRNAHRPMNEQAGWDPPEGTAA